MKTRIFLFIIMLLLISKISISQSNYFSVGTDVEYLNHYLGSNTKKHFNYGISFFVSRNINNLNVSTGFNFSTRDFYIFLEHDNSSIGTYKKEYTLRYLNIPVLLQLSFSETKIGKFKVLGGFIFNNVIRFNVHTNNVETTEEISNDLDKYYDLGISSRLGLNYANNLNKSFILNISPFIDYKLILNAKTTHYTIVSIPDNRLTLGIKIGIEYVL